jgi:hypothetical protein
VPPGLLAYIPPHSLLVLAPAARTGSCVESFFEIIIVQASEVSPVYKWTRMLLRSKPVRTCIGRLIFVKSQERMMVDVMASHVTYMSHPKETAKLFEEAATSAHVNRQPTVLYVVNEMDVPRARQERSGLVGRRATSKIK